MLWLPWKFREVLISILEVRSFVIIVIVKKIWDEANGFIEGNIFIYLLHVKWSNFQDSHAMHGK